MKPTKQRKLSAHEMCDPLHEVQFDLIELEEIPFIVFLSYDEAGRESKGLLISLN